MFESNKVIGPSEGPHLIEFQRQTYPSEPSDFVLSSPISTHLPSCCSTLSPPSSPHELGGTFLSSRDFNTLPHAHTSIPDRRTILDPFHGAAQHFQDSNVLLSRGSETKCLGHGLDVLSLGVISTLVVPTAFGLFIWVRDLS